MYLLYTLLYIGAKPTLSQCQIEIIVFLTNYLYKTKVLLPSSVSTKRKTLAHDKHQSNCQTEQARLLFNAK